MRWVMGMAVVMMVGAGVVRAEEGALVVGDGAARGTVPFTVGVETTVVTGPLRADGTVDYVKAWNERQGKGVTWEENGWARFEVAVGGLDLSKDGETMMWMAGGAMPAGAKKWKFFEDFLRERGAGEAQVQQAWDEVSSADKRVWMEEEFPALADYLEERKAGLDGVVAAAGKEKWWMPWVAADGKWLTSVVMQMAGLREVSNALCARAMLRAGVGDFAGFLGDVMAVKRLARHVEADGVIGVLVAAALEQEVDRAMGVVIGEGRLTEKQCAEMTAALAGLGETGGLREAMDVERRWEVLDVVQQLALGGAAQLDEGDETGLRSIVVKEVMWDELMKRMNRSVDEAMRIGAMATLAERTAAGKARAERFAREWPEEEKTLPAALRLMKKRTETREAYTQRVGAAVEQVMVGDEMRVVEFARRAAMDGQMVRLLLEAGAYRAREGKWAARMEAFLGKGEAVPTDMQGNAMAYVVTEKGVQVTGQDMDKRVVVMGAVK